MRFVKAVNSGKGFITHADQLLMSFEGANGNIWRVTVRDILDVISIDAWIARVGGIEMTEAASLTAINDIEKFIYTQEEYLRYAFTPDETAAVLVAANSDDEVNAIVTRFFNGGINASSVDYITFLGVLMNKGLLTAERHNILLGGK